MAEISQDQIERAIKTTCATEYGVDRTPSAPEVAKATA